ncbi:MAG: DUF3344 domain-containing protein [Methanothermobacter sp.]
MKKIFYQFNQKLKGDIYYMIKTNAKRRKKSHNTAKTASMLFLAFVFTIVFCGAVSAEDVNDTAVTNVDSQQSTVFAAETNNVTVTVLNNGTSTANNIMVNLYASDVDDGATAVATTTIDSLESGASTTVTLTDPTIRPLTADTEYGSTNVNYVTYTAIVDPENTIPETDESNNSFSSAALPIYYNGYKGKRYEYNGIDATNSETNTSGDISTQHVYDLQGDVIYSSGNSSYKSVGWSSRTSTWTTSDLPVPSTANLEDVWLYLAYNWDTTSDGDPNWTVTFNGSEITPVALYMDQKNFAGTWALYKYGLYVYNVTSLFSTTGDNTLVITPLTGNSNALYPSNLVVVYSDTNSSRKQIFINEECDELLPGDNYGVSLEEATAYAPFTGLTIDTSNIINATLYSFAGSAGTDEGNLIWNGTTLASNAWQGTMYTASALIYDVTDYLTSDNTAGVQGTNSGGMVALQQILVVEYAPDLTVTEINVNSGTGDNWFANESNIVSVTVTNQGSSPSSATTMSVDIDGNTYTLDVPALDAGASTTVTVTDPTIYKCDDTIPVSATSDPSDSIPETDETNNTMTTTFTVYNNGYKGKRYTDGDDLETQETWTGTYDVIYSSGDTQYISAYWSEKTYNWTSSDLPIPEGATVVSARLYQAYTYNKNESDPAWTLTFNGSAVNTIATYEDIKGWGSYSYPYGLYVYDVTNLFNTAGNSMTITPETTNNYGLYGAYIIVVYEDTDTTNKTIYINDGFDMLYNKDIYSINNTEAIAYATYNDVNTSQVGNATIVAILAGADKTDQSKFYFNDAEYTGFWNDYNPTGAQTGFSTYDVTDALTDGVNFAAMQSYDNGSGGDNMYVLGNILTITYDTEAPTVTADPTGGSFDTTQTVTLTATDDIDNNPDIYYTLDGTTPTTSSNQYTGPITLNTTTTLKFIAVDNANNSSTVQSETYTFTDTTAPTIINTNPVNGETSVTNETITVTFSEDILEGTNWIELVNSTGTAIPFTMSISGNVLTVDPTSALEESAYKLMIHTGSVTDLAGNLLAGKSIRFTVGTAPTITATSPANGTTNVKANKTITVTFSEAIRKSSNFWVELVNSTGETINYTSYITGGNMLVINPDSDLEEAAYKLMVHTGSITDMAGNPLEGQSLRFTVGTSPTITDSNPADGATDVNVAKTIAITFNEAIRKSKNFWVELVDSTNTAVDYTSYITSGNILVINPTSDLAANTTYKIKIHTGSVTDLAGNLLAAKIITFTTRNT